MKIIPAVLAFVTLALLETSLATSLFADQAYAFQPENPVTSEWLTQHLRRESPKLILTPDRLNKLKSSIVYSLHNTSPTALPLKIGHEKVEGTKKPLAG